MNFILIVMSVTTVLFAVLACLDNLWVSKKKEIILRGRLQIKLVFLVAFIIVSAAFIILRCYGDSYEGYHTYCSSHSPKCENDNLVFSESFCLICSSDIMESGILVDRVTNEPVRFSDKFNSYFEYKSISRFSDILNAFEFLLFIIAILVIRKTFKVVVTKKGME